MRKQILVTRRVRIVGVLKIVYAVANWWWRLRQGVSSCESKEQQQCGYYAQTFHGGFLS